MPTVTLTDLSIRTFQPVPGKQVIYLDKLLKGFGVRVTDTGAKSFVLTYGDDRKRVKLGDVGLIKLADAREKAKNILAERQLNGAGNTPLVLFDDALKRYMEMYAAKNKPKTVTETKRVLNRHIKPVFEGKALGEATKPKLVHILDGIESPSVKNHVFTAAHAFFRWCERYDINDPLKGVQKPPKSPRRQRLLTIEEFLIVWRESLSMGTYGLMVRCLLSTGQRLGQIKSLIEPFVDRQARTMTWPSDLMKNNQPFLFPYGALTHSLLPQAEGLLFTGEDGKVWNNWTDPHRELLKRCNIPHFTRHDCRRFYSTTHSSIGTPPHVREILLTHALGNEVSRTYDIYDYLTEKRKAQEAYEAHLITILNRSASLEVAGSAEAGSPQLK